MYITLLVANGIHDLHDSLILVMIFAVFVEWCQYCVAGYVSVSFDFMIS